MIIYEVKVESSPGEDGKIVKDIFLVEDSSTFGAETKMHTYLENEGYSDFEIVQVTKKRYTDVLLIGQEVEGTYAPNGKGMGTGG